MKFYCLNCAEHEFGSTLDLGMQPPSNRYGSRKGENLDLHRLKVGVCSKCGLVQLIQPMPIEMVRSRYDWIRYNEPEFHLDSLVEILSGLDGVTLQSRVIGLTYKDDSTLERFRRLGYLNTGRVPIHLPETSVGHHPGLETVQNVVSHQNPSMEGLADILLVRHVLEHAHAPKAFLQKISTLLNHDGYLVFEVPDSSKFIQNLNYCFLWEEHVLYFAEATLFSFLKAQGFEVVHLLRYEAALEDSLVIVVRRSEGGEPLECSGKEEEILAGLSDFDVFVNAFEREKRMHQDKWKNACLQGKALAVFGAGHLAVKYINFFSLENLIACVLDDSPDKVGKTMPGSDLLIKTSENIIETDICLLALSPESSGRVLEAKRSKIKPGARFVSIFDNQLNYV
jgi:SAM-dependent methyltransferase